MRNALLLTRQGGEHVIEMDTPTDNLGVIIQDNRVFRFTGMLHRWFNVPVFEEVDSAHVPESQRIK